MTVICSGWFSCYTKRKGEVHMENEVLVSAVSTEHVLFYAPSRRACETISRFVVILHNILEYDSWQSKHF